METGRTMAGRYGRNTLNELLRVVEEVWAAGGALEYRLLEQTPEKLSFDVRRCRYAELYDELGAREFGYCLSCCRDEPYASGFNPGISLVRTQTIMQGAGLCDFRFIMKRDPDSPARSGRFENTVSDY